MSCGDARGYVVTILSGLAGGIAGWLVGNGVSELTAAGDLGDIVTGFLWVFSLAVMGMSVGTGLGIHLTGHERAVRTAFFVIPIIPIMLLVTVGGLWILGRAVWIVHIGLSVLLLAAARRAALVT